MSAPPENGLEVELLERGDAQGARAKRGRMSGAIFLRTTGIVDYPGMTRKMAALFCDLGGQARLNSTGCGNQRDR